MQTSLITKTDCLFELCSELELMTDRLEGMEVKEFLEKLNLTPKFPGIREMTEEESENYTDFMETFF